MITATAALFILFGVVFAGKFSDEEKVQSLLPQVEGWKFSEEPLNYHPETLFEYINGAAEIYLSYDFKELSVGQYQKEGFSANMSVEIYDMGREKNAFGIYSAERFPESTFIDIGIQGYIEDETLNFLVGRYYVKLLCFDCGEKTSEELKTFSRGIIDRVSDKGAMPQALSFFPEKGRVENSQKFILENFMGYSFLHNGYMTSYLFNNEEFDCFLIEGDSEEDAEKMLSLYLEAKKEAGPEKTEYGYHFKDRYYKNIFLTQAGKYLCGVMKIGESSEKTGIEYLKMLSEAVKEEELLS